MDEQDLARLQNEWRFGRALMLVQQWDCPQGLLLISEDDTALSIARDLAEYLADQVIEIPKQELEPEEWEAQFGTFYEKAVQTELLEPDEPKVCLLAEGLDLYPESTQISLKGLLERSKRPFCCIGTTDKPEEVPGYLSSMFFEIVRIGGRFDPEQSA